MKTVCILGGFNLTNKLHELHIIVSRIKNYKFLFPDLDHVKELTLYYELIRDTINLSDSIILINDNKSSNTFSIIFGMAFQSGKELKINSFDNIKNFFEGKGGEV